MGLRANAELPSSSSLQFKEKHFIQRYSFRISFPLSALNVKSFRANNHRLIGSVAITKQLAVLQKNNRECRDWVWFLRVIFPNGVYSIPSCAWVGHDATKCQVPVTSNAPFPHRHVYSISRFRKLLNPSLGCYC